MTTEHKGIAALRAVLQRMRWDDQGGYPGRSGGEWTFVSTDLSRVTPKELDALFALAGIEPDEIVSRGKCSKCAHAEDGRERGYREPCLSCTRPLMSNFVPRESVARRAKATP
jgi:hypothetical protein